MENEEQTELARRERMKQAFDELSEHAERFMREHGHPYLAIVITYDKIEMVSSEMVNPFHDMWD